jgi:hypothetical protein
VSVAPFLTGLQDEAFESHTLVLHDDYIMGPMLAIREGDWKLIVGEELVLEGELKPMALFNMKENPREDELQNLVESEDHQELVASLSARLMDVYHVRHV